LKKILCIDDIPEEELIPGKSLQEIIKDIFAETSYKVIFKKTSEEGVKTASDDSDIKLVLLDIRFKDKIEGPEIADKLLAKAPYAKIIVLTSLDDKGKKISFGWKPNVVHYVLKKELSNAQVLQKLRNLSKAIIEDYENKRWGIEYLASGTINLTNKSTRKTYGIDIPSSMDSVMKLAITSPNKPVINPGGSTQGSKNEASLNKVLNTINTKVLEGTDWNTWGILTREGCAKGQLKLVVGSVMPLHTSRTPEDPYVTQSRFERFMRDVEERLKKIESTLNLKSPQENK